MLVVFLGFHWCIEHCFSQDKAIPCFTLLWLWLHPVPHSPLPTLTVTAGTII